MAKRGILIVLDSDGVDELADAALYGDVLSDTIDNIDRKLGGLNIPSIRNTA